MDQTGRVHRLEGEGEAVGQYPYGVLGQRPEVVRHHGGQVGPGDVLGRDPGHRGLGVGVEHGRRPGAAHPPGGRHLTGEAPAELRVLCVLVLDDLDRDGPPGRGTAQIDQAHSAGTQAGDQAVRAYVRRV